MSAELVLDGEPVGDVVLEEQIRVAGNRHPFSDRSCYRDAYIEHDARTRYPPQLRLVRAAPEHQFCTDIQRIAVIRVFVVRLGIAVGMVVDEQTSGILDPQFGSFVKTKPEKRRRQGDQVRAGNMHRFEARLPLDHPP